MANKRERIYHILDGRCFYCGCKLDFDNFHLDHFKAKSKGGKTTDNLVPSCPECNLFKSNLDIEEFRDKLKNIFDSSYHARMISKYYEVKYKPIVFYYEEVGYGDI